MFYLVGLKLDVNDGDRTLHHCLKTTQCSYQKAFFGKSLDMTSKSSFAIFHLRMQLNHFHISGKQFPPSPGQFHTSPQHETLALWLNIYFLSNYYCLSGWQVKVCRGATAGGGKRCEMEIWGNSCIETVRPRLSVHQENVLSVCGLSLHFSIPVLTSCSVPPQPDEIFRGLTSLIQPHFHTIKDDPLSKIELKWDV